VEYCDERVCLCLCLIFTQFFVHVNYGYGSVLYDGVVVHYIFPVLWMTSYLHIS